MLEQLQRRLFIVAVCVLMLLITALLALSLRSSVNIQRENDIVYLQRMAYLLIDQLENDMEAAPDILANYERKMGIYSRLITSNNQILYESDAVAKSIWQKALENTMAASPAPQTTAGRTSASSQNGVVQYADGAQRYNLAPSTIETHNGTTCQLTLAIPQSPLYALLAPELPRTVLIWGLACVIIVITSHLLLRRAFAPAKEMNTRQKNFIAAASHELKSPLAVIMANAELLQSEPLSAEGRQHLSIIDSECMRMARLTGDLLLLSSADAATKHRALAPVDVDDLLIALYDAYAPLCSQHQQKLHLTLPETPPPTLASDAAYVRQILSVFLDNAVSHTPPDTNIYLGTSVTAKTLCLTVCDDGPGVAACDVPHLFDRFYCADTAHSDKHHTGLGLAIAQTLATQLGGTVDYAPSNKGGACFNLLLPL